MELFPHPSCGGEWGDTRIACGMQGRYGPGTTLLVKVRGLCLTAQAGRWGCSLSIISPGLSLHKKRGHAHANGRHAHFSSS